jgi:hypothetical protein
MDMVNICSNLQTLESNAHYDPHHRPSIASPQVSQKTFGGDDDRLIVGPSHKSKIVLE